MEENNSIQDQGDVVKGTKVPHATPVKHFFCVYLALLIGLGIKMAAVFPFVDTEFTSQATTTPLILVIVIAPVAIMFTGRFWVFNVTSRRWVQFSAVCFTHVVVILLLVDAMQYRDFWGMPPVMQLGFYWTYSYHLGILYFSALVITTLILSTELFSSNINVNHQPGNRVLSYGLTIGGICWVISWTFLDAGMFWSFFIDACVSSTAVVAKLALLVITMRKVKQQELDGTLERIRAGNGADDVFKNGRNGTLHVFKGAGMQLLIFFCIAMEVTLLSVTISKPNMLPVLLQVFPLFFAGFLLWGLVYRVIKDRFWLLVVPCILLVINAALILSDPYGYLVYASATYWLAGLSIPGFIMGSLLHVGAMANGMFSRLFWGSFATFVLAGSIIIALMMKWDSFCVECAQVGVLAGVLAIAVFSLGRLLSGINGCWNKGKRSRVGRDARESLLGYTRLRKQPDSIVARVAIVKSDMLLLALVASGIVLVPLSIGAGAGVSSCEHVLGSYNKDYYLW